MVSPGARVVEEVLLFKSWNGATAAFVSPCGTIRDENGQSGTNQQITKSTENGFLCDFG
jgi:hypothetical protein